MTNTLCQGRIGQQAFGNGRPDDLTGGPCRRDDAEGKRAVFVRRGAPDHGEDHAEAHPGDAETDKNGEQLVLTRRDGEGRGDKPCRVEQGTQNDGAAVAEFLGQRAEDRLAEAPGEVLDRDGHRKFGPRPAEFGGYRKLEQAEGRADGETRHDDDAARDQDGGDQGGAGGCHRNFLRVRRVMDRCTGRVKSSIVIATIAPSPARGGRLPKMR